MKACLCKDRRKKLPLTKRVVERIYSLNKPIPVIHPSVETPQHARDTTNEESGDYILAVGAMVPMKNYSSILKAFYSLPRRHQSKVKLLIIGSDPLENTIRSQARKFNLKNVVLKSSVSEQILNSHFKLQFRSARATYPLRIFYLALKESPDIIHLQHGRLLYGNFISSPLILILLFLLRPRLLKPQSGESSFIYATKTL